MAQRKKRCSKCKRLKVTTEFYSKKERKNGRMWCKKCCHDYYISWYKKNKIKAKTKHNEYKAKLLELVLPFKDVPCMDCGIPFPFYVMDFDHVRGKKKYNIGRLINNPTPKIIKLALNEMKKCDVVCANCHRERTHQRIVIRRNANIHI